MVEEGGKSVGNASGNASINAAVDNRQWTMQRVTEMLNGEDL